MDLRYFYLNNEKIETCEECRERKRGEKGEREGNKVGVGLDREGGREIEREDSQQ